MVSLTEKTIELNGKKESILRFEILWRTPFGLVNTIEEANSVCVNAGLNPNTVLIPVVAAVSMNLYEIMG